MQEKDDFLKLYIEHSRKIFCYILSFVPNKNDADDILQDSVLVMWEKFADFEHGTNFLGWACTIARHKVFKYYREKKKLGSLLDDEMLEAVGSECARAFKNDNIRLSALNGCVSKLGAEDQALVKARFKEGTSLKIYSEQSGRSLNAIYKRMAHIYAMLQDCIEQTMEAWS